MEGGGLHRTRQRVSDQRHAARGQEILRKFVCVFEFESVSGVKKFRKKFVGMEQHLCAQNVCASETKLVFWPSRTAVNSCCPSRASPGPWRSAEKAFLMRSSRLPARTKALGSLDDKSGVIVVDRSIAGAVVPAPSRGPAQLEPWLDSPDSSQLLAHAS